MQNQRFKTHHRSPTFVCKASWPVVCFRQAGRATFLSFRNHQKIEIYGYFTTSDNLMCFIAFSSVNIYLKFKGLMQSCVHWHYEDQRSKVPPESVTSPKLNHTLKFHQNPLTTFWVLLPTGKAGCHIASSLGRGKNQWGVSTGTTNSAKSDHHGTKGSRLLM